MRSASSTAVCRVLGTALLVVCINPSAEAVSGGPAQRDAAPSAISSWSALAVPGGSAGLLTASGLDPTRHRTTALLDVIRVIHQARPGVVRAVDDRRAAVLAYLDGIEEFVRARAAFPEGTIDRSAAASGDRRKSLRALAAALGASLERRGQSYVLELPGEAAARQRRAWLAAAGLDVERLVADFNAGAAPRLDLRSDEVPLPLSEAAWRALPGLSIGASGLARALLSNQRAALLYFGLCSMDEVTRAYLAANADLLGRLVASDRALVAALHAGSLRVRAGRIDVPGGEPARSLWESAVGEPVSVPDRFILAVLERDDGRLAHLYDVVDHMDAAHRAFVLGSWIADPAERQQRFSALVAACSQVLAGWDPAVAPFMRTVYDPAHLLLASVVLPDGRPGSLGWLTFWRKVYDGGRLPEGPEDELKDIETTAVFDAAALLQEAVAIGHGTRRERCQAWCFAQRLFSASAKDALPQVLVAVKGYLRYPALALTLERLGIVDPSAYAAAFRRAEQIAAMSDHARGVLALALYQGSLVLIERARVARALDASSAAALVTSLAGLPLSEDGEYLGAVARWIDTTYLPSIGAAPGVDAEAQVLAAFAGRRAGINAPARIVEYEGARYRLDLSVGELQRIQAIRARQEGVPLDAILAFAREAYRLAGDVPGVAAVGTRVAGLKAAAAPILAAQPVPANGWCRGADLARVLAEATAELATIRKEQDLRKAGRVALQLQRAADRELGRVLVSLAYAGGLGDPESTAFVAGDPADLHDWEIDTTDEERRAKAAWAVPQERLDLGGTWHVVGSLLGLDVGMGADFLQRLSLEPPEVPPTISDNHRQAFTESAVLANGHDYSDDDMARLVEAIRRGRSRVAGVTTDARQLDELAADAGLDSLRRSLLAWSVVHEPDAAPSFFSMADLARLGRLDPGAVHALDAWGTSGAAYDGRLGLHFPGPVPPSVLAGRWGGALLATAVPDIALTVAEALHERRLPAALTRAILLAATSDYIDALALAHEDDWLTLVSDVQRILPQRMEGYLEAVTTTGPLVPVSDGEGGDRD